MVSIQRERSVNPFFTQADTIEVLREMIKDAVKCHYDNENERPRIIRLHEVRDKVITL